MRKLFILIPAMLLTIAMYAKEIQISSATSNIIHYTIANAATEDGDVLVLTDVGPYVNHYAATDGDDYTKLSKNITIKAADGLESKPVIKFEVPFQSKDGKSAKFIGIKFDGESLTHYSNYFQFNDAYDNSLEFEDCEFTGISKYIIDIDAGKKANSLKLTDCYLHDNTSRAILNRGTLSSMEIKDSHFEYFTNSSDGVIENYSTGSVSSLEISGCEFNNNARYVVYATAGSSMTSCEIEDCYFHNNAKSAIYVGYNSTSQACNSLTVENSTFADISGDYNAINFSGANEVSFTVNASLSVDHCTFFKHPKRAIYWAESSNLSISNCIFAQPSSINYKSVECVGGTITNCLSYNSLGYSSAATLTDNIEGNPYFVNIESGSYDFSPASFSPAHNAGTDSKNLGDLRWNSEDSAHPTTKTIAAGTGALKAAVEAVWPGDTIVLNTGTYSEAEVMVFDKSLVVMAAAEASPVIAQHYYSKVTSGADVKFIGIKFDGSIYPANDYCFYPFDNTAGNELHFENCEFVGFSSYVLHNGGSYSLDSLIVNNCYFHNNTKSSVIYFEKHASEGSQTVKGVKVTNSTFANNYTTPDYSVIFVRNQTGTEVSDVEVTVDHCTFYNNPTKDTDHSAVRSYKSTKVNITNCIFAHPDPVNLPATSCYGGTVSNCLTYNLNYYSSNNGHRQSSNQPVLTDNITGNPLFTNVAEGDFSYPGNWTTGNVSPARGIGTGNSDLGDPRWYTDETIPSTNFASPYTLEGGIAVISGNIWYDGTNDYLYYDDKSVNGTARWKLHVEKACAVQVTLDMSSASTTGHKFKVEISDKDGKIGELAEPSQVETATPILLGGCIYLPKEGDYTILLTNLTAHSSSKIESITLSYAGGAVQSVPETTDNSEAWFTSLGTRADGMITFSHYNDQWVKWNISASGSITRAYNVALNIYSPSEYGHRFSVNIYENEEESPVYTFTESSWNKSYGTPLAIPMGIVNLDGGKKYVAKVTNAEHGAQPKIISLSFTNAGGDEVTIPATLTVDKAWFGNGGTRANDQITFSDWNNANSWVKWNVATSDIAYCNVKVSISTDNAHHIKVAVVEKGTTDTIKFAEPYTGESEEVTKELNLGRIYLMGGKMFEVKVVNPVSGSHVKINNVQFEEIAVSTINIPAATSLLPANAMLSDSAGVVSGSPDYINFKVRGSHKYNDTEWARWKINVTEMSSYIFTANVQSPENNGQYYTISVLSIDESETKGEKVGSSDLGDGDRTFATDPITLPVGEYIVKIVNPYPWSQGCVKSISVAQATPVTISENDADIEAVIGANNGKTVDAQLTRTLVAGMYNTICLPFAVSAAEMGRVFPGAVVKELTSSSVEEGDFVLNLNFSAVSEMEAGVPYIIKPAADVANPKFIGVTINKTLRNTETARANFVGNFVKDEIPADENNLFMGANNKLYFPTVDMEILGMRAYFVVHDVPAGAVKRARIIEREQIITYAELVAEQPSAKSQKILRDGQLIIIRDGNMYNVMGAKLQ